MMLYVHHVPGRLRLQTPMLKRRPQAARSARDAAMAVPGVTGARVSATTGSLLITYDRRRVTPATLWEMLREHGIATGPLPIKEGVAVTRAEIRYAGGGRRTLFETVAGVCLDKLLERSAAALLGII